MSHVPSGVINVGLANPDNSMDFCGLNSRQGFQCHQFSRAWNFKQMSSSIILVLFTILCCLFGVYRFKMVDGNMARDHSNLWLHKYCVYKPQIPEVNLIFCEFSLQPFRFTHQLTQKCLILNILFQLIN